MSLPEFLTPFQAGIFGRVAVIGFLVPVGAVLWPVMRAVRIQPVEAIRTGHLASRAGGLSPVISRIPLPGGSLARMPLRSPRESAPPHGADSARKLWRMNIHSTLRVLE